MDAPNSLFFTDYNMSDRAFDEVYNKLLDLEHLSHLPAASFEDTVKSIFTQLTHLASDPLCNLKRSIRKIQEMGKEFKKQIGMEYLEQFLSAMVASQRLSTIKKNKHLFLAALKREDYEYIKTLMKDKDVRRDFGVMFEAKIHKESENFFEPSDKRIEFMKGLTEHGCLKFKAEKFTPKMFTILLSLGINLSNENLFNQHPINCIDLKESELILAIYNQNPESMRPIIQKALSNYMKVKRETQHSPKDPIAFLTPLIPYYKANLGFQEFNNFIKDLLIITLDKQDNTELSFFLINSFKLDPNITSAKGVTLLENIALRNILMFRQLVDLGANPNLRFSNGKLPINVLLNFRSHAQYVGALDALLIHLVTTAKLDLNAKDAEGFSPIQAAMNLNQPGTVQKLIELGAKDFKGLNRHGHSIISWAYTFHRNFLPDYLKFVPINVLNSKNENMLHIALKAKDFIYAQQFLNQCDVNAVTFEGNTPLFYAMQHCPLLVMPLIEKGANLFVINKAGYSPMDKLDRNSNQAILAAIRNKYFPKLVMFKGPITTQTLNAFITGVLNNGGITPDNRTVLITLCLVFRHKLDTKIFQNQSTFSLEGLAARISFMKMTPEYVQTHFLETNMAHVNQEVAPAEIPPAPADVNINELLTMFNEINVTDEKGPGNLTAEQLALGHQDDNPDPAKRKPLTKEALYKKLENYINHVNGQLPKVDVPKSNDPIKDAALRKKYYDPIKNVLQHLTMICKNISPTERAYLLRDLALGAGYCSTRWYGCPVELYKEYMLKLGGKPVERNFGKQYFTELATARSGVLQSLSGENVHHFAQYAKLLADKIKIPYLNSLIDFNDHYHMAEIKPEVAYDDFIRYYNPAFLIDVAREFIKLKLREERVEADASSVNAWFGKNIPADYKAAIYKKHEIELRKLRELLDAKLAKNEVSHADAEKAVIALFNRREVPLGRPSTSVEDAIANSRYEDYITSVIYKDYEFPRLEGILHMLKLLDVVRERVPGLLVALEAEQEKLEEKLKKVEPTSKRVKVETKGVIQLT